MIVRFGLVIGWTATAIAVLLVGIGIFGLMREQADHLMMIVFFIVPGILIYIAGRAVRFIIVGT
jgi:hypothetical protein